VYIDGLETDIKLWDTTSRSNVQMLEGKTAPSILATLVDQNPDRVCYLLYPHSVDTPGHFVAGHISERTGS
jgi:hypothetical protein